MEKKKKLPLIELLVDELSDFSGVQAISLVDTPAIEVDFLYFNEDKTNNYTLSRLDEDKQIVTGPALIPDKLIYRYDKTTGEEYNIYFSQETVDLISQKYLIEKKNANVTIQHEEDASDISLIESWIVTDPKNDKSHSLGYNVPKGTWMTSFKINNLEAWDRVKSGELKAFSVEASMIEHVIHMKVDETDEQVLARVIELLSKPTED